MKTPLAFRHQEAGARFIEFSGWEMPVHYGSQLTEHHAVRNQAGCFDVSHMAVVDVSGSNSEHFLHHLLVGDVHQLKSGQGFYTLMLNDSAGIVDDLIVYRRNHDFRLVINAGTTQSDLAWMNQQRDSAVGPIHIEHRVDSCILAVQGPTAVATVASITGLHELPQVNRFHFMEKEDLFVARTGYTGEDGVEVVCTESAADEIWSKLIDAGVSPCGLGARDSLRLEAALNLYGHDMNKTTHPLESRLAWTVDWRDEARDFIGREALSLIRARGSEKKLVGLKLAERGIPREGCLVTTEAGEGIVTSGTFSPTLKQGIALARVPAAARGTCHIQIRKHAIPAKIARLPFVAKNL